MTNKRKAIDIFTDLLLIPIDKIGSKQKEYTTFINQQVYFTKGIKKKVSSVVIAEITHHQSGINGESKQKVNMESKYGKESKYPWQDILSYLNSKTGKSFRPVDAHAEFIVDIFDSGYSADDMLRVIDYKTGEWLDNPEMVKYLQPSTLFQKSKFDGYLNSCPKKTQPKEIKKSESCPACGSLRVANQPLCYACRNSTPDSWWSYEENKLINRDDN